MNRVAEHGKGAAKRRAFSLRTHLLMAFGIFVLVAILVTWLFQIALLNQFYEQIRRSELRRTAKLLAEAIEKDTFETDAFSLAVSGAMGISIYRIEGNESTLVLSEAGAGMNPLEFLPPDRLSQYYADAHTRGGSYLAKITFGGYEVEGAMRTRTPRDRIHLLYIGIVNDAEGNEYMTLLYSALVPLDSTVSTLKRQFIWIVSILVVTSILIAVPLSRRILRPIRYMNEAANRLAKGDYNADFEKGSGYRETKELARTLNFAAHELSRTDQLQKELIGNISHDLRTPLTMIRAYSEAMRDIPGENTPENVQIVIDETNRLSDLVNDLLDVSRLQSGTHLPKMQVFDLTTAVREVLMRYDAFLKVQDFSILFEGPDTAVPVFADRGMILQVIYNLVNNAINYAGEDRTVRVVQTMADGTVRVEVRDTGEGIAPEQIPLIWDRYYKVDRVHRMARVGTGLGLSIVKSVLELHGAQYGVESEVGRGSVFWFALPIFGEKEGNERETT